MSDQGNSKKLVVNPDTGDLQYLQRYDGLSINYVPKHTFEGGGPGFTAYMDAAQSTPEDGTGGVGLLVKAFSTDLNDKLRGNTSLCFEKPAVNLQGHGQSLDIVIDPVDQGKTIKYEFEFRSTANYVDGDMGYWIYDVDNLSIIYPSNINLPASGLVVGQTYRGDFKTAIDSLNYRIIFHVQTVSALQYDFCISNLFVGPFKNASNTSGFNSDWDDLPVTPTGSMTTNAVYSGRYRREGPDVILEFEIAFTGATNPATNLDFDVPSILPPDVSNMSIEPGGNGNVLSSGYFLDSGSGRHPVRCLYQSGIGKFLAVLSDTVLSTTRYSSVTTTSPSTIQSGDSCFLTVRYPVLGWGTGTKANEVISGRLHTFNIKGNLVPVQVIPNNLVTKVTDWDVPLKDESGGWNPATSEYTIQENGDFTFSVSMPMNDNVDSDMRRTIVYAYINGAASPHKLQAEDFVKQPNFITGSTQTKFTLLATDLKRGDIVDVRFYQLNGDGDSLVIPTSASAYQYLQITKLNNLNSQLVPDDLVPSCKYKTDSGQAVAAATNSVIIFEDREHDNFGMYNPITGIITFPKAGKYLIHASIHVDPVINWVAQGRAIMTAGSGSVIDRRMVVNTDSNIREVVCTNQINALMGQTTSVALFMTNNAITLVPTIDRCILTIVRLGD